MHSKYQSLEIKMEKQSRHRKNVRDNVYDKTPTHRHMTNKDDVHKKYHNACQQQPMQNCQQQHMQYKQHHQQHYPQQHNHQQQQQQSFYVPQFQCEDQRGQHQHYYPVQSPCCYQNVQEQQLEQDHQQQQQQQQKTKESEWDREFLYANSSEFSKLYKPTKPYQSNDYNHNGQTYRCSHVHIPLPRNPQMHMPTEPYKKDIEPADDRLLYKNSTFTTESSITGINDAAADPSEPGCSRQSSTEAYKYLKSARAYCQAADAHFNAKYGDNDSYHSEEESTTGDSKRTHHSECTVISGKSGINLRSMVCSQMELQEALNQSIDDLNEIKNNIATKFEDFQRKHNKPSSLDDALPKFQFEQKEREERLREERLREKRLREERLREERLPSSPQNVNQQAPTRAPSPAQPSSNRPLSISVEKLQQIPSNDVDFAVSVDDIVNARVISPMMRKIQRMYLNNLREEMAIMEDLERVPHLVSEVYKNAAQQELLKKSSSSSK